MNTINRMGLRVAGVVSFVMLLGYGLVWGGWQAWKMATSNPEETVEQVYQPNTDIEVAGTVDSDGDGVPDKFENIYKTNPQDIDTDGDGVYDADEIMLGTNPLLADSEEDAKPATGSNVTDLNTYTNRYLASLPEDVAREDILKQENLEAFIEGNLGELTPSLEEGVVKTSDSEGKEAVTAYLNSISATHNSDLVAVTSEEIEVAFTRQLTQPEDLQKIEATLKSNLDVLKNIPVPAEATALHLKYISASQALLNNVAMLNRMGEDLMGGLIGAKNIELLGPVFDNIAQDIAVLEEKYGIE